MDLRELRTFVAVVEEGRFAGAAQRLNLSQPAISHTIRGLEKQCGVMLLERTSSGVVTTAAGKLLISEARAVLARFEQAVAAMSQGSTERPLRLGIPFGLPPGLLGGALAQLVATYPATAIAVRQLTTARQIEALGSGGLDLGLVRHRPSQSDLDAVLIADESLGAILSECQSNRLGPSDEVRLESLAGLGLDWHGFPRDSSPAYYDELTAILRSHGLRIEPSTADHEELGPDVAYASVSLGRSFGLAPASSRGLLPPPVTWRRLTGDPLRVRTWAVWPAASRRRDLGHLVALLEDGVHTTHPLEPCVALGGDGSRRVLAS
ncbi:LysR family transcriptional regulator [Mycobacterium sp. NPDC003449]